MNRLRPYLLPVGGAALLVGSVASALTRDGIAVALVALWVLAGSLALACYLPRLRAVVRHPLLEAVTLSIGTAAPFAFLLVIGRAVPDASLLCFVTGVAFLIAANVADRRWQARAAVGCLVLGSFAVTTRQHPGSDSLVLLASLGGVQVLLWSSWQRAAQTLGRERRRLSAAAGVMHATTSTSDVAGAVEALMAVCQRVIPAADSVTLHLLDREGARLEPLAIQVRRGQLVLDGRDAHALPGEGLAGWSMTRGEGRWPTSTAVARAFDSVPAERRGMLRGPALAMKSAIATPLRLPGGPRIGAIVLGNSVRERAFTDDDLGVLAALADEAASVVDRTRRHASDLSRARTDALTGLPNHGQLMERLTAEVARASRRNDSLAVMFCDLDWFKQINDDLGHDAGDRALTLLSTAWRENVRDQDVVGRYGGDEFVCLLPDGNWQAATSVAERVRARFTALLAADEVLSAAHTGMSTGIACLPADGESVQDLLAAADLRLRAAKQARPDHTLRARSRTH